MSEWISVEDRFPLLHVDVLTFNTKNKFIVQPRIYTERDLSNDAIFYEENESNQVTHWMPLPEPPSKNVEGK
jgi:hypothetical protein